MACGSIESPALLLRSHLGGPAVGDYLRVHPSTAVSGIYDQDTRAWFGPPGLSKADIAWYDTLFKKISEAPKFVQWVDSSASLNKYMGSAEFTDFINQTMATFDRLFKQMGVIK